MGRRLSGYVPIHDGDRTVWYGPDDEIPDEVAAKIGDHAWIEDDEADGDDSDHGDGPPSKTGRTKVWLAYARTFDDVDVADDAKRVDIIAAIEAAGHPVE